MMTLPLQENKVMQEVYAKLLTVEMVKFKTWFKLYLSASNTINKMKNLLDETCT